MDNNPLNFKVKDGKVYQNGKRTSILEAVLKFFGTMALLGLFFIYMIWESLNTIIMMIVQPWENWATESFTGLYHMNEASDFDWSQGDWYFIYPILVALIILVLCYFLLTLKFKYAFIRFFGKWTAYIILFFAMTIWYLLEVSGDDFYNLLIWLNS